MFTFSVAVIIALSFIVAGLLVAIVMYEVAKARGGNPPRVIAFHPGEVRNAVNAILAGNRELAVQAAQKSLQIWLGEDTLAQRLVELGFDDVERRLKDPTADTPIIDLGAFILGKPKEELFAIFKAEFLGEKTPPKVPPTAAAVALMFCLLMGSTAEARSPIRAPDRWYPLHQEIQIDAAVYSRPVSFAQRREILVPDRDYVHSRNADAQFQGMCHGEGQQLRFWERTAARRIISAPVRIVSRWRPLRHLLRRC